MIKATNKATGEVIELETDNLEQVVTAWRLAQEYSKTAEKLKEQLKKIVPKYIDDSGKSQEVKGFMFKSMYVQRKTYDKSIMREVFDQDLYDTLLEPDKTAVDKYIKENLESLGDISTKLRDSMIEKGKGYSVTKLERLDREEN